MSKSVSIVMPTFNGGKYIKRAIESVISQNFSDWKLLVINDGSKDDTESIAKEYVGKDDRIIYLKNEVNLGIQKTLNKGLRETKGKYIARIDDDDEWIDKDKLKKQFEFLEKNPDYVLVGTGVVVVDENRKELFRYLLPSEDTKIRNNILSKNRFAHSSVLFDKNKALEFGGYSEDKNIKHLEDYDLWLKMGTVGKFANINEYAIRFMARSDSLTSSNRVVQAKRALVEMTKFKNKYPKFLKGYVIGTTRLFFFYLNSIVPINEKIVRKIFSFYKN